MKKTPVGKTSVGILVCLSVGALVMNCNRSDPPVGGSGGAGANGGDGGGGSTGSGTGGVVINVSISLGGAAGSGSGGSDSGAADAAPVETWPPAGFVNVTHVTTGDYATSPTPLVPVTDAGATGDSGGSTSSPTQCSGILYGVVRDFKMGNQPGGHPDFETAPVGVETGIVETTLGPDGKPVYAHPGGTTKSTTGEANFNQWYNDVPDVNEAHLLALHMEIANGTATFSATLPNMFYPLDNLGFGNQGQPHNYSFTTEIHTSFIYNGGETFSFSGDDDIWVFINNQLVIDLGGRHAQTTGKVNVDSLGLTVGNTYDIAVFNAERHTNQSNFQIQTTLSFTNCGYVEGTIF